jgi:Domain of unknown function (DUF4157)
MKSLSQISEPLQKMSVMSRAWCAPSTLMQRKCPCGGKPGPTGECAECRNQRLSRKRQMRSSPLEAHTNWFVPPIVNNVLGSSGQPLDRSTRAFMEPRFGHDFSRVRVHADTRAAESAKAVGAFAYTVGRDIVFARGQYAPRSAAGQRLLAHELAHVAQQAFAPPETHKQVLVGRTNDPSEREARSAAQSAAMGSGRISVQHQVPLTLQRDRFRGDDDPIHKPISKVIGGNTVCL